MDIKLFPEKNKDTSGYVEVRAAAACAAANRMLKFIQMERNNRRNKMIQGRFEELVKKRNRTIKLTLGVIKPKKPVEDDAIRSLEKGASFVVFSQWFLASSVYAEAKTLANEVLYTAKQMNPDDKMLLALSTIETLSIRDINTKT